MFRQIFLFTDVNSYSAESIVRQLLDYDRISNEEITMFINSPGGNVTDFFSIYNVMETVKSKIRTVVLGEASSCAAIIAACGDTRLVSKDSEFMLHEVWSFLIGSTSQLNKNLDRMKSMQDRLVGIITQHTNRSRDEVMKAFGEGDKFFSAQQAIEFGLADQILDANEAQILKLSEGVNVEGYEIAYQKNGSSEVQILKEGKYEHPEFGLLNITAELMSKMKSNFDNNIRGIDISIDYTHENDHGQRPAACWVKALNIKNDGSGKGLFACVEFTPRGRQLVLEKEYKYASADFTFDYKAQDGKHYPYVLNGGTLTNRPFIKEMNPIKLSEKTNQKEKKKMEKPEMISALKEQGVDVVAMQSQITALESENASFKSKIAELNALPAQKDTEITALKGELKTLNDKIVFEAKDKAFNELLAQGKVVPAQKENVMKSFNDATAMLDFFKAAPAVVNTKPSGSKDQGEDGLTDAEQAVVNSGVLTKEEIVANRKIDPNFKKKK